MAMVMVIRSSPASIKPKDLPSLTQEETQRTIHELQVHQVDLKMQNDELSWVQAELEVARAHYFNLYHLAPIGYYSLSREGPILEPPKRPQEMPETPRTGNPWMTRSLSPRPGPPLAALAFRGQARSGACPPAPKWAG